MPSRSDEAAAQPTSDRSRKPPRRRTHIALKGVFPKRKTKPCIEPDGLGVVERVFYNIKPGKPQVVMGCVVRLKNPAIVPHIPAERILDLIKIAAADHFRLCISLDPKTLRAIHLADTAADLPISYRIVNRDKEDTWHETVLEDINTNFNLKDTKKPLWRVSIVMPDEISRRNSFDTSCQNHSVVSIPDAQLDSTQMHNNTYSNSDDTVYHPQMNGGMLVADANTANAPTGVNPNLNQRELEIHDGIEMPEIKRKSAKRIEEISSSPIRTSTHLPTIVNSQDGATTGDNSSTNGTPRRRGLSRQEFSQSLGRFFTTPTRPHISRRSILHQPREWTVGNWKVEWPEGQPFPRLVRINADEVVELPEQPEPPADGESIELLFTFNHVLGDGLSMWAFMRSFFDAATPERLSPTFQINLNDFPCQKTPPPLIDNLLRPNVVEITPIVFGMLRRFITLRGYHRFKGRTKSTFGGLTLASENIPADKNIIIASNSNESLATNSNATLHHRDQSHSDYPQSMDDHYTAEKISKTKSVKYSKTLPHRLPLADEADERIELGPEMASPLDPLGPPAEPLFTLPNNGKTRARFLSLDHEFTEAMRKKCNSEKTTVAAAIVVAALAAVRTLAETMPGYSSGKRSLPARQGWVVTSSVRHLLPNNTSLYGGERTDDPSLKIFGGYGGSIFNNNLRFVDSHDFWERCRRVKRDIRLSYRTSIMRMKLVNWCFRHQLIWEWVNKRANLSKLSRAYSVELANLGAWDAPCALPGVGESDPRLRLAGFSGILNSSFDGVRGLFCIGTMSISGVMSITVAYDVGAVLEQDADLFISAFVGVLYRAVKTKGRISVEKARMMDGTIPRPCVVNDRVVIDEYGMGDSGGIDDVKGLSKGPSLNPNSRNGSLHSHNNSNNTAERQPTAPVGLISDKKLE